MQRIDHDGVDADRVTRADDPTDRIEQQNLAETVPLTAKIDGQPPDDSSWHGIMRQSLCEFNRQVVLLEARRA